MRNVFITTNLIIICLLITGCAASRPDSTDDYYQKAMAKMNSEAWDEAISYLNQAIELNPDSARLYIHRGTASLQKDNPDSAIADFNLAIKLEPNNAQAYNGWGVALIKKQNYKIGMAALNTAIKLDPNYADAYNNRASARQTTGDLPGAITDYETVIRLNPGLKAELSPALNKLRVESGKAKKERAVGLFNQERSGINQIVASEKYDEALEKWQKFIRHYPEEATILKKEISNEIKDIKELIERKRGTESQESK